MTARTGDIGFWSGRLQDTADEILRELTGSNPQQWNTESGGEGGYSGGSDYSGGGFEEAYTGNLFNQRPQQTHRISVVDNEKEEDQPKAKEASGLTRRQEASRQAFDKVANTPMLPPPNARALLPEVSTNDNEEYEKWYADLDPETKDRVDELGADPKSRKKRKEAEIEANIIYDSNKSEKERERRVKKKIRETEAASKAQAPKSSKPKEDTEQQAKEAANEKREKTSWETYRDNVSAKETDEQKSNSRKRPESTFTVDPFGVAFKHSDAENLGYEPADEGASTKEKRDAWFSFLENIPGLNTFIEKRLYKVSPDLMKNKKLSDDQKIMSEMRRQAKASKLFENAADLGLTEEVSDYTEDWFSGDNGYGKYDEDMTEKETDRAEQISQQRDWAELAYVPLESQHIDKDGWIRFSPRVEKRIKKYMNHMRLAPHEMWLVFHQAAKYLGYSPDSNGKFLLSDNNKVPDWLFIYALDCMEKSMAIYHHPYHRMDSSLEYGRTSCYPVGIITPEEANILCRPGGVMQNVDPWKMITDSRNDFVNHTLPDLRREAYKQGEKGLAQLLIIENQVRALCSLSNISPRVYAVSAAIDRGYEQMLSECDPTLNPEKDEDVNEERRKRIIRAEQRRNRAQTNLDNKRNRTKYFYTEDVVDSETGEVTHKKGERVNGEDWINGSMAMPIRSSKVHYFDAACTFTANWAKFMGVVGFASTIISAHIEHFVGNANTSLANRFMHGYYDGLGYDGEKFKPTEAMFAHVTMPESIDAIIAWKTLMRVGGQDAVTIFYQRYKRMNKENVSKFLREDVNQESLFTGETAKKVKAIARKASDAMQFLLPGDVGFGAADAKRWLEGLMINNMINANNGEVLERSFTASEMLEMMETMGMEEFIAAMTDTIAGRDAVVMMRNQTMARESPLTHIADSILKRSGLTNVLITLGVDTYFTYGLNLVQNMLPMSNTISYLAVRGINKMKTGGVSNVDTMNMEILDYQMGGLDEFGVGLAKNLIYDFSRIVNVGIFACFTAAVFMIIGFDEPEDEGLKYNWEEYMIGSKIGLGGVDENGNPRGIPLYRAWWLDDLTLFGLPLAYAICAQGLDQKLGDNDPHLAGKLFRSGCWDVVSGASIFDLIRALQTPAETLVTFDNLMTDPNATAPSSWFSFAYMEFFELPLARAANKLFVPNFVRDLLKDEYDHTPYYVYDRSSSTPGKRESVKDWEELQRRIESRYNPIYALFNNLIRNHYFTDKGDTQKTGYLFNEMPLATMKDQRRAQFMESLDYHPEGVSEEELPFYNDQKCEELISIIDSYGGNIDTALANGFMIPYDLRVELIKYCKRRQNFEMNNYNQLVQNGIRGAAKEQAWADYQNNYNRYGTILSDWAYNTDRIPWSDDGYVKLRTDTEAVYYYKNTGKPASLEEYVFNGGSGGNVEIRYIPKGNRPNSLALFTTPETRDRGYNFETKSSWFKEGVTDTQRIFDESVGQLVPYGRDEGVPLNTAIFGGNPGFKTNEVIESDSYNALNQPTMGYRGYVPFEERMLLDLPNYDPEASAKSILDGLKQITNKNVDGGTLGEMGEYKDKDYWKSNSVPSYGYTRYYSGGRGGGGYSSSSGYNPKIYSSPRNINADKATTMYAKTPYGNSPTSYLRPGFSTKGSREAYERQDI